ncbi:GDSL esterase/lipase EXL3-like [Macadamia integrifolia]|uniref:GDSL esterase/lipase EXL3-like n=1 Tax=Macadamia integrifolia TaxID=60698 RepID=UPI001C4F6C15|nr:GDSL esterase/lipase EXL3-like [Macadamia integrifolia]
MKTLFVICGGASSSSSSTFAVLLAAFIIASCFLFQINQALIIQTKNNFTAPALFAFGDSYLDTGNNNNLPTVGKCNFPPYGKDFPGGIPTGRFCNGKISSDFIAEELGIKELLPAFLDPTLGPQDLLTGVCFASSGAGFDPITNNLTSVLSLPDQLKLFMEYKEKLKMIAGEERTRTIISESLYILSSGTNDFINTYFSTPFRKFKYDIPSYVDFILGLASSFIQELYNMGARRIIILDIPPIGCLPSSRTIAGGKERNCAEKYNQAALVYNSKLPSLIDSLHKKLPQSKIVFVDIYKPVLDIIQNPNSFGFDEVRNGCCGTGNLEVAILCNPLVPVTCPDDSKNLFWDSIHPTENGCRVLTTMIIKQHINGGF